MPEPADPTPGAPGSPGAPGAPEGPTPRAGKHAIAFIFVTMLLDVIALGVIIPVIQPLILEFRGGDFSSATQISGLMQTLWMLLQFFASPILGSLSDHFGRRPVLLLSLFGLAIDYAIMAMAPTLVIFYLGRLISGVTAATYGTAGAYIADVTPPEKRAAGFGMLGAAFGLGFIIGPALGGWLGSHDLRLPFWVSSGLALANAMYGIFVLPESLPKSRRVPFSWKKANPVGSLMLYRNHPGLLGLAGVLALYWLAHFSLQSVFVLYTGYRYGWDTRHVGFMLSLIGVGSVIVQGALVRPVVARLGERRSLLMGLTFGAAGFLWYALAPTQEWFWASVPVFALAGFTGPSLQGLLSRRVEPTIQGRLQGANGSVMSIGGILGPVMYSQVFAWAIGSGKGLHAPGAPYLLAAGLLVIALALAWKVAGRGDTIASAPAEAAGA